MPMIRHSLSVVLLALLGACGEGSRDTAKPEVLADQAPPTSIDAEAMAQAVSTLGDDAYTLYKRGCLACHGDTAEGVGDYPSLAKLSIKDVDARLRAYRAGETVGPRTAIMAPLAKPLSDEQIAALALYLGS